jgi:hypothetical protein
MLVLWPGIQYWDHMISNKLKSNFQRQYLIEYWTKIGCNARKDRLIEKMHIVVDCLIIVYLQRHRNMLTNNVNVGID